MPSFPSAAQTADKVKLRFRENPVSKGVAQRFLGVPRGVYAGFLPQTTLGSRVLTLAPSAELGFSLLKVGSLTPGTMADIYTDQAVTLDFTGHAFFPVSVIGRGDYQDGRITNARVLTRSGATSSPFEVLIATVDLVAGELVVTSSAPATKQLPTAFQGQTFGYMGRNAIRELDGVSTATAEVIAARTDLTATPQATLTDRIQADLNADSMASRLALQAYTLAGNEHESLGSTANISGSFSEASREFAPLLTLNELGSETVEGAITGPNDAVRNACVLIETSNGNRPVDANRAAVYGRITYLFGTAAGTAITFTNADTTVIGSGSPFSGPIQLGDLIEGGDGLFYAVGQIIDPNTAELTTAYQGAVGGPPDVVSAPDFRRFTCTFVSRSSGSELPATITAGTKIRPYFPAFFARNRAIFDATVLMKQVGEREPLPDATDLVAGKALLAVPNALAGSIRTVQNVGTTVATDVHTLNFVNNGASLGPPGVVNISVPGAQGPDGTPANAGAKGPTGAPGPGYALLNSFEKSGPSGTTVAAAGTVTLTHDVDFSLESPAINNIAHLMGGWAYIDGPHNSGFEELQITTIQTLSASVGRIIGQIVPSANQSNTEIKLFLGAVQ